MKIDLYRISGGDDDTIGYLTINDKFECFTLEDEYRSVKIAGETRIPAGCYVLGIQEAETPLTKKYLEKYGDWFENHIEILDIPNFTSVYIHIGNTDDHTAGCILVGETLQSNLHGNGYVGNSTAGFKKFYKKVFKALRAGKKVTFEVHDEPKQLFN